MRTASVTVQGKKLAVSSFKHISLMSVDSLSFFYYSPSLQVSSAFRVHRVMISVCMSVRMFECVSMRVCACGFFEISGNTVGSYRRNLQQCHVSRSFSDSLLCYLQVVCVQLQIAYI